MLALYGGTFDPPHNGHFKTIIHAAGEINAEQIELMPCARSPLKAQAGASDEQRLAMLQLGCNAFNQSQKDVLLSVNPIELSLPAPSYTVDTLRLIRQRIGTQMPLCFFLGEDSLYTLTQWKAWQQLTQYCHLVVLRRDGVNRNNDPEFIAWVEQHKTNSAEALADQPFGCIYHCHTPLVTISSTAIRTLFRDAPDELIDWLPNPVLAYAQAHNLYHKQ